MLQRFLKPSARVAYRSAIASVPRAVVFTPFTTTTQCISYRSTHSNYQDRAYLVSQSNYKPSNSLSLHINHQYSNRQSNLFKGNSKTH